MKRILKQPLPLGVCIAFLMGCTAKGTEMDTKDIVMYANLKNEAEAIKQYGYYHSKEGIWPEVGLANKESGIQKIKMYRFQNQLIMILTVPKDLDMAEADKKYAASSEKIGEWGKLMEGFFAPMEVDGEEKVWVEMKKIHHYEDEQFH